MLLHNLDNSYLAGYKPPQLSFAHSSALPRPLRPVWSALRDRETRTALRLGYEIHRKETAGGDVRAGLLAALAFGEWESGVPTVARQLAYESIALLPGQWIAHRVLITAQLAERDYTTASRLFASIDVPEEPAAWDEPLSQTDCHLLRAACSWMTSDWEGVARDLTQAYPDGVASMPPFLQQDWFRLAFYRENPRDALSAARQLISEHTPERADILIQTLVRQGWHKEALALYRSIYDLDPTNELLRRRMVGLCIREGEVQEARRLMELGALRLAG